MPGTFRHLQDLNRACSRCSLAHLCLPYGLEAGDIKRLETLVETGDTVARGETLFTQGEPLAALYAVSTGAFKTAVVNADGLEQILGFYFPGDLLGLDAFAESLHQCTATALEPSRICRIPIERLDDLVDDLPNLRRQLMRLMSQALSSDEQLLLTLGRKDSEGRIATLLHTLSRRRELRGLPASPVRLSMKRAELANFLGMRLETVSRVLRRLSDEQVIDVARNDVVIHDFESLAERAARGGWAADRE